MPRRRGDSFTSEDYRIFLMWIVAIVVIVSGAGGCSYKMDKFQCERKAEAMGREWKHGFWTGCMVKMDGEEDLWVDISRVRDDGE